MNLQKDLSYPSPLIPVPTWNIHDSTKLQTYLECPRKYFYSYILGWRSDQPNIHFIFGAAWHEAMEYLLLHQGNWNQEVEDMAFVLFWDIYIAKINTEDFELYSPKDPGHAREALKAYINLYKDDRDKVLFTEVPGTVPIDDERVLHFKIDAVMKGEKGYYIKDHKTSKSMTKAWGDQWRMSFQIACYCHVLFLLFPDEFKFGAVINGAFFRKKGPGFERKEVAKSPEQLQGWLWHARYTVLELEHNHKALSKCSESDPVMMAFPCRPTSCTKWGTCEYIDFCCAWQNPLQRADRPPVGMKVEHWNPQTKQDTAKQVFKDGKIEDKKNDNV